ncbi:MAG: PRC-barrel domain-containing protein [Sporomusaceae bacterium]|nr:PRC-barrel domain-containing protein [Sporomusaceae bacterium]
MKKSVEIIGLPVISIDEGRELGVVKDLVINPTAKEVTALLIEDVKWFMGAKTFPFSQISGIGQYAVTIEKGDSVSSILDSPELLELLNIDVKIIGSKILTKTGQIQGKVVDIIVDEAGKIVTCDVEDMNGNMTTISSAQVVTFGKEVTITDGTAAVAVSTPVETVPTSIEAEPTTIIPEPEPIVEPAIVSEPVVEPTPEPEPVKVEPVKVEPAKVEAPAAKEPAKDARSEEASKKFDERQRKYLLGKKANRRIEMDNGVVIVEQGGEITEEVIQKAKLGGKFVELSMSIQ